MVMVMEMLHDVKTGATGLVGRQLVKHLLAKGDEVNVLTRDTYKAQSTLGSFNSVQYFNKQEWGKGIEGTKAVINLAGEPISTRCVDGNTHDASMPECRSKRVAKQSIGETHNPVLLARIHFSLPS